VSHPFAARAGGRKSGTFEHPIASCIQLSAMPLTRLFSTLVIAALCNAAWSQDLPSSCSNCVAVNQDNVYNLGRPSVVWCSSDPPRPLPVGSSSGTCLPTTSVIQTPFKYPNGTIQCLVRGVDTINPPPCPATAPFASFASCECSNSCFAVTEEEPAYMLRSCASCVALGYNWITEDDLNSSSCILYDDDKETDSCSDQEDQRAGKKCIRAGAYSGFPYCSPKAAFDKRYGPTSRGLAAYTTSSQCARGLSFCSSIRVGKAGCIAMIVFLSNIPIALIIMCWSRKFIILERSPSSDSSGMLFECTEMAFCSYQQCHRKSSYAWLSLFCEFWQTYFYAPMSLTIAFCYLAAALLHRICVAASRGFRTLCCCKAVRSASAANLFVVPHITAAPAAPAAKLTECVFPERKPRKRGGGVQIRGLPVDADGDAEGVKIRYLFADAEGRL
jgi:hypothetical protein